MSESTEIANAIYYLASTIRDGVCVLGFGAVLIWVGSVLLRDSEQKGDTKR